MDANAINIITLVILIIFSAYFSATETAFSSLNRTRMKTMAESGNKKAELAYRLSEDYDRLLSTILVGNNVVNIAASSIATILFIRLLGDIGATVSTVVLTIVVLIFGEISPKSIAKDAPERFAMFSAPFINALTWLLTPVNYLFTLWKKLLSRVLKVQENAKMSQAELLMLVDEVQQDGSIDKNEGELLRNAIEFTERRAEDILTHRIDLEAVPVSSTKQEIADKFSETKFSRLLVYDTSIDNIVGVIHQKDFYTGMGVVGGDIHSIMTPPLFVLKSERINGLLRLLQTNKSHVAVVVDEYGGTLGIVTMEDILEELVGEIWDEHDEVVEDFVKIDKDTYRIDGAMNLEDFCQFFEVEIESEVMSVSGWIMEQLGRIPEAGDHLQYENLIVTVAELDQHRIAQVDVKCLPKPDSDDGDEKDSPADENNRDRK